MTRAGLDLGNRCLYDLNVLLPWSQIESINNLGIVPVVVVSE